MAIAIIIVLICIPLLEGVQQITTDDTSVQVSQTTEITSVKRVKYRFRRIFTGATNMFSHRSTERLVPTMKNLPSTTSSNGNSSYHLGATTTMSNGSMVAPIHTTSSILSGGNGTSVIGHLSSSAKVASYGGGVSTCASGLAINHQSHASPTLATPMASLPAMAHATLPSHSRLAPQVQPMAAGGPRRAGEYSWGGILYGEDDEEIGTVDGDGNVWKDGIIIGTYIDDNFTSQGEAVDNPIGAPWILLLFAAAFALYIRLRKNNFTFQSMKHSSLKILTLLSLLTLALPQAWGTTNKFTNGTTIYVNTNSVSGWASDNATIGAIFYYQDNDSWCIETANDTYSDSKIGNKTAFENSSVYKTATKVANGIYSVTIDNANAGSVRFLRIKTADGGTTLWNYSKRMSVDEISTNNCVTLSDWNSSGTWTTYNPTPEPSYTFTAGTTIYYDLTAYGNGANIYNAAGDEYGTWQSDVSSIIAVTLTKDLTITASSNLFMSAASSWKGVKAAALPTTGQNMIVSTDGAEAHWGTYGGSSTYTVSIDYLCGTTTIKTPSSVENVDNVTGVEITAPAISGYTFDRWIPGTGTSVANATNATTIVKTTTGSGLQCQYTSNITQVYLAGTMTNWADQKRLFSTTNGDNYTLTVSDLSTSSNYTFKIIEADSWCGKDSKTITSTEAGIVLGNGSGGNIGLHTSATSGNYIFDYVLSTHTLSVTYPVACTTPTIVWATAPANGEVGDNMTATVTTNQPAPSITWESSNISVATVTTAGVINYIAEGSATITAKYTGNGTTYCDEEVSVNQEITVTTPAPTWALYSAGFGKLGDFDYDDVNKEYHLTITTTDANKAAWYYTYNGNEYYTGADDPRNMAVTLVQGGGRKGWGFGNNKFNLTIKNYSGTWKLTATEGDPITDGMVAPIYYIYMGEAFNLPEGFTYAGASLGTNTLASNTFTANQLGEYDVRVTKVGFSPKDIKVRVYRYYVKHAWGWTGAASTSNPQYNAAWVWEPLAYVDATHASFTGTGGNLATNGANLCWDYTYDWAGVYQTDADAACNFHPGLDNASKQGKWGNGAHECNGSLTDATTGATTWKETSLTPGTIYDFVFNETLSGSTTPTNRTSSLSISGTSKTTYAVNFTAITNTTVSTEGGYITSTLGTISGVKALDNTSVTFTAHAKDGYIFKGWYSNEACTASLGTAPTYSSAVSGAAIQVYAKFVEPQFYLHAEWNGWAESLEQFKFTKVSATQYSYTIPAVAMTESLDEFLIRDENNVTVYSWKTANCGTNVVSNGNDAYPNFKLNFSGFCSVTIQIDIDAEGHATVSASYTQNPDIYIVSNRTLFTQYDWGVGPCTKMTHTPGSNIYTYSHNCMTTEAMGFTFRVASELASSAVFNDASITAHTHDAYVSTFTSGGNNHDFRLTENRTVTITLTVADNGTATLDITTTAPSGVYFVNTDQWGTGTVYAYAWSGDNNTPGWPGTAMTLAGQVTVDGVDYDYYFYPVTTGKVIFNNGEANGSPTKRQTANQNVQVGKYFMASDICYGDNGEPQPKTAWYDDLAAVSAAHIGVCSGWYLHGSPFGGTWTAGSSAYPFNQTYREMSGVYYRVVSFADAVTKHFRVTDGTKTYSGDASSSSDYVIAADKTAATLTQNTATSFAFTPIASHDYWFVVNTSDKTFWIQDPEEYHHIEVNETDANNYGEYLLTTSSGAPANTATDLFANGEHYLLTITAANSGVTPHITVNSVGKELSQSGDVYTYEGTMPGGNITIVITYTVAKDFTFETRVNGTSVTETDFGRTIVVHTENPINFTSTPGYQYTYSLDGGSSWRIVDAGTYVINSFGTDNIIKFRARGSDDGFSTYVEKIIDVTIPAATVSLSHSGSASVGGTLTLTATANISGGTYTFYVTAPGEAAPTSVYSGPNNTYNYVLPVEGHYAFSVNVADAHEPHIYNASAVDAVDVTPDTYYLRYNFVDNAGNFNIRSLNNVPMTYNAADGTYYYYHATVTNDGFYMPISSYNYGVNPNAAVMTTNRDAVPADWKTIHNNEVPYVANNTICVFHYDPNRDYVWITSVTTNYRVKSVGTNGTFYSNAIMTAGEKISFYASTDATLSWQTSDDGGASWADAGAISTRAASNGVWVAEPSNLNATTLTLTAYTGAYYVNNTALSKQEMTDFSSTSTTYYDHYCVAYLTASTNVGATLGNTINTNLATRMPWYTLPSAANVRYEYTPTTNAFTRTLISGSSTDDFAQIYGVAAGEIYQTDGSTQIVKASALKLNDGSDWVYTADFKVKTTGGAIYAKLTGGYNGSQQWILARTGEEGADDAKTLICGDRTTNGTYSFRLIYDYKTNQCISGWNPSDLTISSDISMNANFFVIRDALNSSTLQFIDLGGHNVDILKSIIFVLDIDRDDLFNSDNSPKHDQASNLFQVTLPYDVTMGNIFGLPDYGTDWIIQDYKGELRKKMGYDGSADFWATLIWSAGTTLKQGRGYVISTNYDYSSFREIAGVAKKYLYFPSGEIPGGYSLTATVRDTIFPELKCTKPGREVYDSDWRAIGARSFYTTQMHTDGNDDEHTLDYFYEWDGTYGNYTAWALEDRLMQPTRNYLIQYHGKAQWTKSAPSTVAARRAPETATTSSYRILLQNIDGEMQDQTYIKLSADGTDDYVIGHDLSKSFSNAAPQIYSITAGIELAGNNVSDTTTCVNLGISLPEAGEYTISLGNQGQVKQAILFDREQNDFVNLSYGTSYTFMGIAGKQENRFFIFFTPASPGTATGVEDVNGSTSGALNGNTTTGAIKLIEDGHIVILLGGHKYTTDGRRIQ